MLETLLKVIPFSLAGAVNPLGILIIFSLLAKDDRPIKRAWIFLAGSIVVLIALIFISKFLLSSTSDVAHEKNATSATIDIVFGVILILWTIFKKNKQKTKVREAGKLWQVFVAGIIFMAILDLETIITYLASMKIIYESGLEFFQRLVIYVINILIVMSTMACPVLLASLFPKKSAKILDSMHQFLAKHGQLVTKIVMQVIALYLLYLGLTYFY